MTTKKTSKKTAKKTSKKSPMLKEPEINKISEYIKAGYTVAEAVKRVKRTTNVPKQ